MGIAKDANPRLDCASKCEGKSKKLKIGIQKFDFGTAAIA